MFWLTSIGQPVAEGFGDKELKQSCKLVVRSVNQEGRRFRPSDWIERISTTMATFGDDHRLTYSDAVRPRMVEGEKCLVIDPSLKETNPTGFEYIMSFVNANQLQMSEVCETLIEDDEEDKKAS